MAGGKMLAYLTVYEIDPFSVNDDVTKPFRTWLHEHGIKNADGVWRRNINAWNKATLIEGWPPRKLALPPKRARSCLRGSDFPSTLNPAVDAFLARGRDAKGLFSKASEAPPLEAITFINQKECLRWFASALVDSGI